jgi:eukaryotic-like serine/threonine-protein kinase
MGLTQKILAFTSLLVVALVVTTLAFTTAQANHLAHTTIEEALKETRGVWDTFQNDRYKKLSLGVGVLANDPAFKAAIATDQATVFDMLKERGADLKADFFIATDPGGILIARSDRPGAQGDDLSKIPVVAEPLEGKGSATVWRQEDELFHAVSAPMRFGPDLVGVLVAGYAINESLANDIHKLTHSQVAYLVRGEGPPRLSVSSLGPKEGALKAVLGRPELAAASSPEPFEIELGGERHVGIQVPLTSAGGEVVGSVVALRSLPEEMASYTRFRNSLILVSLVVMAVALVVAYFAAARITGPVRRLVGLVERARDGSYHGAVSVNTTDEIGILARSFNSLLAELREKEQMIGFLREGMTLLKKGAGVTLSGSDVTSVASAETVSFDAATAQAGLKVERGGLFAGRYEILVSIGRGGMGVVYRALDKKLDEVVALKVLRPEILKDDASHLERFKQEIKLARKITHRNVLRTHDFGDEQGAPYISMEFLEGVTLKDLIQNKGALPVGVGLRIAKQICAGLEAAHRQGVVHRDIKPQNMLIIPETGEVKIMDFGIARVSEVKGKAGLTSDGTVMGTPDYMPPEQAQGRPADFRSDIYSLGVVLFEIFTGKLPFSGDTVMAVVMNHIQKPPPNPRSVAPTLPESLEKIILRCLEKDPARRYSQVAEILKDLTAVSSRVESTA